MGLIPVTKCDKARQRSWCQIIDWGYSYHILKYHIVLPNLVWVIAAFSSWSILLILCEMDLSSSRASIYVLTFYLPVGPSFFSGLMTDLSVNVGHILTEEDNDLSIVTRDSKRAIPLFCMTYPRQLSIPPPIPLKQMTPMQGLCFQVENTIAGRPPVLLAG